MNVLNLVGIIGRINGQSQDLYLLHKITQSNNAEPHLRQNRYLTHSPRFRAIETICALNCAVHVLDNRVS
jgi:hypothetical protein